MSTDELAPAEVSPTAAMTHAPVPSDAELEAIVREHMPDSLRDSRYPRKGWQRIGRNILRFAWTLFVAYTVYVGPTLFFTWLDGGITTFTQAAHILALGRLLPFIDKLPLDKLPILALVIPVALFIALILAARWAAGDLKSEKDLIAKQDHWVRHAITEEKARRRAQAEAEAAVAKIEPRVVRIEDKTDINTTLGATAVIQGEAIRDDVAAVHSDVRSTKATVEEIAERQKQAAADIAPPFTPVRELDRVIFSMGDRAAATYHYIRTPVWAIYEQAVVTLRAAAADNTYPKQGILVTGAANAGKTRLALETLKEAVPGWDTLVWNVGDREDKIPTATQLAGRNVVVFLDDIQNYATGGAITSDSDGRSAQAAVAGPAAVLQTLYQRIRKDAARIVFVATCRREDYVGAEKSLGWFFEQLDTVAIPTFNDDKDSPEAQSIIAEFRKYDEHSVIRNEWNGTLGSLVLGLGRKRLQYVNLVHQHDPDNPAVPVLRAMKLLTLGGVPELTGKRVRAVCIQILHELSLAEADKTWDNTLKELKRLEFTAITPTDDGDVRLAILKEDYFVYVVDDYPADYEREPHRKQLLTVLTSLNDDDGLFYLGNGFYFDDQFTSAIAAYEQAIRLNPQYATAYYNMGNTLDTLQRYPEALAAYEQAIRLNPQYATAYYNLGDLLNKLGRYSEALSRCDYSLSLEPNSAITLTTRAEILNNLHRYEEALVSVERALILGPNFVDPWRAKATALLALGREDEARAAEERAKQSEEQP